MKDNTLIEFFNNLGKLTAFEIETKLQEFTKNNKAFYNRVVGEFEDYILSQIGLENSYSSEFLNPEESDLRNLTKAEIFDYKEFEIYNYRTVFDFLTIEMDLVKLKRIKATCINQDETMDLMKFVIRAFNFKEACKVVIGKLLEQPQEAEPVKVAEVYKTQILFKVGLLFADGKMDKYFTINKQNETVMNSGFSAPKIAKELGNDSYTKFILASINNYTKDKENGSKNIFNSRDMMLKIISHCETEKITISPYFKSRLPIE